MKRDGIGERVAGGCLCEVCRSIVVGQLKALLASIPRESRAELLVGLRSIVESEMSTVAIEEEK